jgi:hypothetical protein
MVLGPEAPMSRKLHESRKFSSVRIIDRSGAAQMERRTATRAQAKGTATSRPDSRLVARAWFLGRDGARQVFQNELRAKPNGANSTDPRSGEESEDLP